MLFHMIFEGLFVELSFRKCKWLLFGTYQLPFRGDNYYFENQDKAFSTCSTYEKRLLIGDFNTEISELCINFFVYERELRNLVKEKQVSRASTTLFV